jgi:hypothetical protein
MVEVVEQLLCLHKALSSKPTTTKKKKKTLYTEHFYFG